MPHVELASSASSRECVEFRTPCGRVSGTALKRSGHHETSYDVVQAHHVSAAIPESMAPVKGVLASFDVVGTVTFMWEDGVGEISAHGFSFWISPEELGGSLSLGDRISCRVENFTLWV